MNARLAVLLTAIPMIVFLVVVGLVIGALVGPWIGLAAGLAAGLAVGAWVWRTATSRLLRAVGAHPSDAAEQARAVNLLEGLCATVGLRCPELWVIESEAPNCLAVGRSPRHAVVAITTGLSHLLNRVELEAVLAHELIQIKRNEHASATLAYATVAGPAPGLLAWARTVMSKLHGAGEAGAKDHGKLAADRAGVMLTRYPPGMIGALARIGAAGSLGGPSGGRLARSTAAMWLITPDLAGSGPSGGDAGIEERLEALREL